MTKGRLILLLLILVTIAVFFSFDLGRFLNLETLKAQQAAMDAFYRANPLLTVGAYFSIYVAVTGLSLPGALIMTLAGGAIFGLLWGFIIVSFASAIGATLAFLASRFLFRDAVQHRFGDHLRTINKGIETEGPFYLFALRLVPLFPFFIINLVMGLTPMKTRTFYWVSQVGMLAGTAVFINAGTQIAGIESLDGILSPGLIGSFVLLAVFPILAKKLLAWGKSFKVYQPWRAMRPAAFDYNLVVIGAGSAGLVASYIAAAVKAKVALVERHKMGGDCLHTGCVPSKALLRSAKFLAQSKRARSLGLRSVSVDFQFADVMDRVKRVIETVEPHDSVERYTSLGVDCIQGEARIRSPWSVEVSTPQGRQTLSTRAIVIATGARPFVPPIPGLDETDYLTSDNLWDLQELPRSLQQAWSWS